MNRLRPAVHAIALALAGPWAGAQELNPGALLSVEIIGAAPLSGIGVERRLLPYAVQTASGDALRRQAGSGLADFMGTQLAGVNVAEISGSAFQGDVTYHGFRASPVLGAAQGISVYLDGVRVNEPFGDVVNWDMVPEAALSELTLVPGANPLFGLNTLGGALALSTRSGHDTPGTEATLTIASGMHRRADIVHGVRLADGWHALVSLTAFGERGWRDHSDSRAGNAFLKVGRVGAADDWQVSILAGRSRLSGNGLLPLAMFEQDRRQVYTYPDQARNQLFQAALSEKHQFDATTVLAARAYLRNSRRSTVGGDISAAYEDYIGDGAEGEAPVHAAAFNTTRTRQRGYGVSVNLSARRAGHQVDTGGTFDASSISFSQVEQGAGLDAGRGVVADQRAAQLASASVIGRSRIAGLYAADTWTLSQGASVTMSVRWNFAQVGNTLTNGGVAQAPERFTYRRLNPSLGAVRDLGPAWSAFASLASGNRVPTVIELGCADPAQPCRLPVGLQSDPYLKQVVARTAEAGLRWHRSEARASLAVYRTSNRDDILFMSAGAAHMGYFANFPRTLHRGTDLVASTRSGRWSARASYSYLDASYDASGELFAGERSMAVRRGTPIAGLPRHTLKAGFDRKFGAGWTLGADAATTSKLVIQGNEDGLSMAKVAGRAVVNLNAHWRGASVWEFSARINNLLDRRYASYGAMAVNMFENGSLDTGPEAPQPAPFIAPGAPRAFAVTLRAAF